MALANYYDDGTASVANGATAVTGQGTAWKSIGLKPGDTFIGNDGRVGLVSAVNSNTSLTLVKAWPGTTQAAAAYAIQPVAPGVDVGLAVTELLETLSNGILAGLAEAGSGENKLAYYSGAGVAALLDFPAGSRTQIAAGLKTAQSSLIDATAGRLMLTGAFGLGNDKDTTPPQIADFDDATVPSGFWGYNTSTINRPSWASAGGMLVIREYSGFGGNATYIAFDRASASAYIRRYAAGAWGPWRYIFDSTNVVGTVAQSSGVPTGALFEWGSVVGSGRYLRIADGTQICISPELAINITSLVTAPIYRGFTGWTLPAAFADTNYIAMSNLGSSPTAWGGNGVISSASGCTLRAEATSSQTGLTVNGIAIGRWF